MFETSYTVTVITFFKLHGTYKMATTWSDSEISALLAAQSDSKIQEELDEHSQPTYNLKYFFFFQTGLRWNV